CLLAAAATPIPVALRPDVHMNRLGVAICAHPAAPRHRAYEVCEVPLADAGNLYVGSRAVHMEGISRASRAAVAAGISIARGHDDLLAIAAFNDLQHSHQRRLQAGDVDALGLGQETVRRHTRQAGGGRDLEGAESLIFIDVDIAVIVQAGPSPNLEPRRLADARQGFSGPAVAVTHRGQGERLGAALGGCGSDNGLSLFL